MDATDILIHAVAEGHFDTSLYGAPASMQADRAAAIDTLAAYAGMPRRKAIRIMQDFVEDFDGDGAAIVTYLDSLLAA